MSDRLLPFKREVILHVKYGDFERAVQEYFNRPDYEVVCSEEWANYSSYEFNVEPLLDQYALADIASFRAGQHNGMFMARKLLCQMCIDGVTEAGKYVIRVSW